MSRCRWPAILMGAFLVAAAWNVAGAQELVATAVRTGTIGEVNLKGKTFSLKRGAQVMTFAYTDTTAFTLDGQDAQPQVALQEGARAVVSYNHVDNDRTAIKVTATSAANRAGTSESQPASQPATQP